MFRHLLCLLIFAACATRSKERTPSSAIPHRQTLVKRWPTKLGERPKIRKIHSIRISPNDRTLVAQVGVEDHNSRLTAWDLENDARLYFDRRSYGSSSQFSTDSTKIINCGTLGEWKKLAWLRAYDPRSGEVLSTVQTPTEPLELSIDPACAMSPDGSTAFVSLPISAKGQLIRFPDTKISVALPPMWGNRFARFSPDGKFLAVLSGIPVTMYSRSRPVLEVFDATTGAKQWSSEAGSESANYSDMFYFADGKTIALVVDGGLIATGLSFWEANSGKRSGSASTFSNSHFPYPPDPSKIISLRTQGVFETLDSLGQWGASTKLSPPPDCSSCKLYQSLM